MYIIMQNALTDLMRFFDTGYFSCVFGVIFIDVFLNFDIAGSFTL